MSAWRDALDVLAEGAIQEFGEDVCHVPMLRSPNGRPAPDESRPAYWACGIFDKNDKGTGFNATDLNVNVRGDAVSIPMVQPVLSLRSSSLQYPVGEGDEFIVPMAGARFRVIDVHRDSAGMVKVRLEQLGRPTHT